MATSATDVQALADNFGGLGFANGQAVGQSMVESRRNFATRFKPSVFRIVGVTFENRQKLLAGVKQGDAMMLVKEPSNAFDPNAVMAQTLDGQSMGYISKGQTYHFKQNISFGRVKSIGHERITGNIGLTVETHLDLPALAVDALPSPINLQSHLLHDDWVDLNIDALSRADHRCEVSGTRASHPFMHAVPMWAVDDDSRTVRIYGIIALADKVAYVKDSGWTYGRREDILDALYMLRSFNGWTEEECETYLSHVEQQRAKRARQSHRAPWVIDLSWLASYSICGFEEVSEPSLVSDRSVLSERSLRSESDASTCVGNRP